MIDKVSHGELFELLKQLRHRVINYKHIETFTERYMEVHIIMLHVYCKILKCYVL